MSQKKRGRKSVAERGNGCAKAQRPPGSRAISFPVILQILHRSLLLKPLEAFSLE